MAWCNSTHDDPFEGAIEVAVDEAQKNLKVLGEGRNRITFELNDRFVLKVPLNEYGVLDNETEAKMYRNRSDGDIRLARCRKVLNSFGLPLLVMERVDIDSVESLELPHWVDFIDCSQVGYTKKGELVAYDYA